MKLPGFFHSLRFRLLVASLAIEAIVLAILLGNALRLIDTHLTEQTERRLAATESAYKTAVTLPLIAHDYATLREILEGWKQADDIDYLVVTSADGRRLAAAGWPEEQTLPTPLKQIKAGELLHVSFPVEVLGKSYGTLQYGLSTDFLAHARNDLLLQGLVIALSGMFLTALVLIGVGYWLTRHLVSLAEASSQIASGDYRTSLPKAGDDEIGLLTQNFRQMAEAVESRINELAAQFSRQHAIFDALGEGIYGIDPHGRCTFINQSALQMLGLDEAEVIGQDTHQLFHHSHGDGSPSPAALCPVRLTSLDAQKRTQEDWFWRKDGHRFPVLFTVTPLMHGTEIRGAVIAFRDITAQRKTTQALRDSSERLLGFINALPDIVVVKDGENRWQTINHAAQEVLHLTDFDWKGKDNRELGKTRPEFGLFHEAALQSDEIAWQHGKLSICTENIAATGAEPHICEVRKMPLFAADGSRKALMVIARDMTEKLRIDAELEQHRRHLESLVADRTAQLTMAKASAEAANVAKSAFLANMSHEIRTPLNAITGMAHLIRRAGITPEQAERLDKLEAASSHLLEIINAVLDISKIEAGKFSLEHTEIQLDSLFANLLSMLQARADAKHLALIIDAPELKEHLLGDPTRLQQALLNYASNAIKFTEQGSVTIRAHVQEEDDCDVLIRFEVIDTGIGIAPATLEKLFSAFEQADNSTTRKYGGTGLGLAITRRLAELMGGQAGASSQPGQGSTFWFTAKLRKVTRTENLPPHTPRHGADALIRNRHSGRRVLLAEDEPVNREITTLILQDVGLIVDHAEDGLEAVAQATHHPYDLILMDMQMPNMDGLEATRRIRQHPELAKLPVIAMTANAFVEDKALCFASGMNDFIAKPARPDDLFPLLLKWLEQVPRASH